MSSCSMLEGGLIDGKHRRTLKMLGPTTHQKEPFPRFSHLLDCMLTTLMALLLGSLGHHQEEGQYKRKDHIMDLNDDEREGRLYLHQANLSLLHLPTYCRAKLCPKALKNTRIYRVKGGSLGIPIPRKDTYLPTYQGRKEGRARSKGKTIRGATNHLHN